MSEITPEFLAKLEALAAKAEEQDLFSLGCAQARRELLGLVDQKLIGALLRYIRRLEADQREAAADPRVGDTN